MSQSPVPVRSNVAVYALAVGVLFVLPLSLAMLLFSGLRDPKSFQFAHMITTSLGSISGLAVAVSLWNSNRALAHGYLMIAASAAFTTWGIYVPDQKLIWASCSLVAGVVALILMYRPLSSFLRQRRGGT